MCTLLSSNVGTHITNMYLYDLTWNIFVAILFMNMSFLFGGLSCYCFNNSVVLSKVLVFLIYNSHLLNPHPLSLSRPFPPLGFHPLQTVHPSFQIPSNNLPSLIKVLCISKTSSMCCRSQAYFCILFV